MKKGRCKKCGSEFSIPWTNPGYDDKEKVECPVCGSKKVIKFRFPPSFESKEW